VGIKIVKRIVRDFQKMRKRIFPPLLRICRCQIRQLQTDVEREYRILKLTFR